MSGCWLLELRFLVTEVISHARLVSRLACLLPVGDEAGEAGVGQGVLRHLEQGLVGDGGYVSAGLRRLEAVQGGGGRWRP